MTRFIYKLYSLFNRIHLIFFFYFLAFRVKNYWSFIMKFKLHSGGSVVQNKSGWLRATVTLSRFPEFSNIVLDKQSWFRYSWTKLNSVESQYCPVSCIQWNKSGHSNVYLVSCIQWNTSGHSNVYHVSCIQWNKSGHSNVYHVSCIQWNTSEHSNVYPVSCIQWNTSEHSNVYPVSCILYPLE